jgi:hypothetical protein
MKDSKRLFLLFAVISLLMLLGGDKTIVVGSIGLSVWCLDLWKCAIEKKI